MLSSLFWGSSRRKNKTFHDSRLWRVIDSIVTIVRNLPYAIFLLNIRYIGCLIEDLILISFILLCFRLIKLTCEESTLSFWCQWTKTNSTLRLTLLSYQVKLIRVGSWANFESSYAFLERKWSVMTQLWKALLLPHFSGLLYFGHWRFFWPVMCGYRMSLQNTINRRRRKPFSLMIGETIDWHWCYYRIMVWSFLQALLWSWLRAWIIIS